MTKHLIFLVVSMLSILNPIGNAGIFLGLTKNAGNTMRKRIAVHTTIAVFIILFITVWVGINLLNFFGISLAAFEVAGSLVVFRIGFEMLHAKEDTAQHHTYPDQRIAISTRNKNDIAVVPLAIPIIAGPGAISTVILHGSGSVAHKVMMSGVIFSCALVIGITLWFSPVIARLLGVAGTRVITRLMGLILSAIAAQMLINGLLQVFPGLK